MRILITILARGGSKGVPGKNIKVINGKPLIAYSIKTAKAFQDKLSNAEVDIELSTDSEEIKGVAAKFGLETNYVRPEEFATDKAGKVGAIEDILLFKEKEEGKRYDYVLDLDVTSPLRTIDDLIESLEMMEKDQKAHNLFSVSEPHRNPYFNMVEIKEDGYAKLVKPLGKDVYSRQAAPLVYDMNASFYFYRRSFFDGANASVITEKCIAYKMEHLCFDIDNVLDFEIMEYLFKENKLNFFN